MRKSSRAELETKTIEADQTEEQITDTSIDQSDDSTAQETTEGKSRDGQNPDADKENSVSVLRSISDFLLKLAIIGLIFYLLYNFVFYIFKNKETGMSPALKPADLVFVDRLNHSCVASDLVVFEYDDKILVRRVIAVPGDTVDITAEGVLVNGVIQLSPSGQDTLLAKDGFKGPVTLSEGQVFVLSDERANLLDSRVFGPIDQDKIIGKVMFFIRRRNF